MKFLHMIPPSSRTMGSMVEMIEEYFPEGEHQFYSTKRIPVADKLSEKEIYTMTGQNRFAKAGNVMKALSEADHIIWHGLFYPDRFMLFLFTCRRFLRKSTWVIWGLDLHSWKDEKKTLRSKFVNFINDRVRAAFKTAVVVFPTDKEVYESRYKGKCFVAPYPMSAEAFGRMEGRRHALPRANGKIFVQVAHNSYPFNHHLDVIETISHFDTEKTHYIFPMSYGNEKTWPGHIQGYEKEVVDLARDLFGQRAHFLKKLISKEAYNDFLWNMDIAIFPANRQNGVGNIIKLLYMGNKVFLSRDNPVYGYFKSQGIEIGAFESLEELTEEEFLQMPDSTVARQWVIDHYHPLSAARAWDQLFSCFTDASPLLRELEGVQPEVVMDENYAYPRKKNYLCLLPYYSRSVPVTCNRVCLMGADNFAIRWAGNIRRSLPRYVPAGFISDTVETLDDKIGALDVIGTTGQLLALADDQRIVATIEDPKERARFIDYLEENEIDVDPILSASSWVWPDAEVGEGSLVGPGSIVQFGTNLGRGVLIEDSYLGVCCTVGDCVTVMSGCRIGDGVTLGEGATIGPNVIIEDGAIIEPYTVVTR